MFCCHPLCTSFWCLLVGAVLCSTSTAQGWCQAQNCWGRAVLLQTWLSSIICVVVSYNCISHPLCHTPVLSTQNRQGSTAHLIFPTWGMTKYIVKSLYCFHLCSALHQCHPYYTLLKFHCKTELSTSLPLLSIWAFSQEQCTLFSQMSCEMRKLPYIHFTNRGLRHRDINVNRANSLSKFIVWLSKGSRHFIALHFSSAMQFLGLHWKLQAFLILFQQVRLKGSDKKSRNWRTHRHHLWEMSVKWCDLNPSGILAHQEEKKVLQGSI